MSCARVFVYVAALSACCHNGCGIARSLVHSPRVQLKIDKRLLILNTEGVAYLFLIALRLKWFTDVEQNCNTKKAETSRGSGR